jgi:hypothetical protein
VRSIGILGVVLVVLGIAGLVAEGFTYKDKDRVDVGPIGVEVEHDKKVRIPRALAALSLASGVVLTAVGAKKH